MKKNIYIFAFCSIGTIILALLSPIILRIWIGTDFEVDIFLIFMVTIYTILALWGSLYTSLLNGIGKINLIAIVSIISAVINIPLSIVCIERIGVSGVVLGTIISMLSASILEPLQARHIIKEIEHQN